MATHKRSRSDTEHTSSLASSNDDSSITSVDISKLAAASKRARKSAPIEKLLNTFELCEQVLDYLPMYDILRVTQVCRAFKANVDNSHRLQVKLFLTPDFARNTRSAGTAKGTLLSGVKATQHIAAAETAGERQTGEVTFYVPHPDVQPAPRHPIIKHMGIVAWVAHCIKADCFSRKVGIRRAILRSADLWSKQATSLGNMFLTQPPIKAVQLFLSSSVYGSGYSFRGTNICVETGVRFRDIFKVMQVADGRRDGVRHVQLSFTGGMLVDARAQEFAVTVDELSVEDDPTRWVLTNGKHVLKEGGFEFS
jgi:hypothetical protein